MTGADLLTSAPRTFVSKVYAERPFALHGLEGISDAQIEEHLALYAGYVKQVNLLNEELAATDESLGHPAPRRRPGRLQAPPDNGRMGARLRAGPQGHRAR